ncbi:NAD(P)H-binding protein [Vibrio sp. Isolate23]|uniref:NAD-dependent epimerase/dehydratase family protein n=1 Tax=Vibrio sp. Isolate23 TaxID=2908533 RepID=UPI001EFD7978|nr:NAD(P)H-binding protein [Vibrio sp. Isolate23]
MKTILIIGGGWLGKPLAHYLETIGHKVFVSRTTDNGVRELESQQLSGVTINLQSESTSLVKTIEKTHAEIVIGCFPPGFRKGNGTQYAAQWLSLVQACQVARVTKIVMVSSTTVYPNLAQALDEEYASLSNALNSDVFTDNARVMLQAEQHVIDSGLEYGIVRCSGLVGPNRHPSRFVNKLKQVSDLAPANMLHLTDAIGATSFLALNCKNVVANATTPNTVSKAEFYQAALDSIQSDASLPPIVQRADKRILAERLISLGYRFHYQHTLELV